MINRQGKSGKKNSLIKTFTYFIPAPPHRKSGYREREFDKIMQGILTSGFELLELQTQGVGGEQNGGLFIIATLKAGSKKVFDLDEGQDIQERFKLASTHSSPDIILEEDEDA